MSKWRERVEEAAKEYATYDLGPRDDGSPDLMVQRKEQKAFLAGSEFERARARKLAELLDRAIDHVTHLESCSAQACHEDCLVGQAVKALNDFKDTERGER